MQEIPSTLVEMSKPLIEQFNYFCKVNELVGITAVDHIGIKCSSHDIYEKRRRDLENESTFIYQSIISNRRIAIISLKETIKTNVGDIKYLELSDQKPDGSQIDKIDHVEIVPVGISYEELISHLHTKEVEIKEIVRPHHTTHDITLPSGFSIKISKEFLINKIKRVEII